MRVVLTEKIGPFLGISSVLAVCMLLAAGPVQAHDKTLRSVGCSSLPGATFFGADETAGIISTDESPSVITKRGQGTSNQMGSPNYHYAKVTIPALAAGEVRVFDNNSGAITDAVLCRRGTQVASSRTNYSSHNSLESAQAAATRAQTTAQTKADDSNTTESAAKTALRSAASALRTAATKLRSAGSTSEADAAKSAADNATTQADQATNNDASDDTSALGTAATALGTAATALGEDADAFHSGFKIRSTVKPGDEEYIVVVAQPDEGDTGGPPTSGLSLNVAFNGALVDANSANKSIEGSLSRGDQHQYTLDITGAGLLTVETKGSTDTAGMLSGTEEADDEDSGSGNNFKMVVPVTGGSNYTLTVDEGQGTSSTGKYTLDMTFKVAQTHTPTLTVTGMTFPAGPAWADNTGTTDDGGGENNPEIKKEPNNSVDEDYFLFTIADANDAVNSGFLTVEATGDGTPAKDANTTGTLYGPMGEIDTDSDSGTGNHFKLRAPVQEGKKYLVKVSGSSEGAYRLKLTLNRAQGNTDLLTVPGAQNAPIGDAVGCTLGDPSTNQPAEICKPAVGQPLEIERYVFNVTESGALDVRTTGSTDTVGALYGPNGNTIATDDNSGAGNNFRISVSVNAGLHLVEVSGKNRQTEGVFNLIVNFVPGAEPTDPTDPTDPTPPPTIDPDPTGALEEPANGSTRSGLGLIRGWVCQDAGNGVEIRITNADGARAWTLTAPYGSDRGDVNVSERCEDKRTTDVGFAAQFNYNLLPAGTYTIGAWVGREQVGLSDGQTNTFTVVRISNQAFLPRLRSGEIEVPDFPRAGDTTILEWDQASQNFQIKRKE